MVKRQLLSEFTSRIQDATEQISDLKEATYKLESLAQFVHTSQLDENFEIGDGQSLKEWKAEVGHHLSEIGARGVSSHWDTVRDSSPSLRTDVRDAMRILEKVLQDDKEKLAEAREVIDSLDDKPAELVKVQKHLERKEQEKAKLIQNIEQSNLN
jgi:hypothetical protein